VNPEWRRKLDDIVSIIEEIRTKFSNALGLNRMLNDFRHVGHLGRTADPEEMTRWFRSDRDLGQWMDDQRQRAINLMNVLLDEAGMQPLRGLHEH
jgi:hypothetical protein